MKVASRKKTYTYRRTKTGAFDIPAADKPIVEASNPEFRSDFHRSKPGKGEACMYIEIPEYVVVEGAGSHNGWVTYSRVSAKDALSCMELHYTPEEIKALGVAVMKRNSDGTLN